jgi:F-type H+-transporting ATPase subunit b
MATSEPEPFTSGEGIIVETPEEREVFPPFDATTFASQLLWFAITFGVLYYLLAKVALPRIAGILEGRRDRIAADLDAAERLKSESEAAAAGYERALAEARGRASGIAEAARGAAKQKADAQRRQVEGDLAGKLAAAEARIAGIKERALGEVGTIAGEATDAVVSALIGAKATAEEVVAAVSAALGERKLNA